MLLPKFRFEALHPDKHNIAARPPSSAASRGVRLLCQTVAEGDAGPVICRNGSSGSCRIDYDT